MARENCRVCGRRFFSRPLLLYPNMPRAAQYLPDASMLPCETGVDLEICQCGGCGLVQLTGEPVPYYREVIRAAAISPVIRDDKTRQFAALIRRFSLQGKKILEVGCGRGEFLSLLGPLAVDAHGLEFSAAAVDQCRSHGLQVTQGYLDNTASALPNAPFDAFLMLMFLEHMPDPNSALQALGNNLSADAIGLIEVPNFDMAVRNTLFSEFVADHLFYFTKETLQTTLNLNGFEVIDCHELRDDYVISAVVKKRQPLNTAAFSVRELKIKSEINAFIDRFAPDRVAVWGAGHQALAIIAMAGIKDKIRYVIDSAPFKQGKYTAATHLPIVAPDILHAEPIEAVIVIAGSYSDEVAEFILRNFNTELQVAVLRDYGLVPAGGKAMEENKRLAVDEAPSH